MHDLQGILLDVDGTLVDSNDAHARAWVQAFAEQGVTIPFDRVRGLIGMGGDKLMPAVADISADSPQGEALSKRRGEIFQKEHLPTLQPFPRVKNLLARLKQDGFQLAVASSAKKDELKKLLRLCGADQFIEASTSSDDADNSKPDPDIIQASLKRIGLAPAQAVLIGDTPYDIEAGRRAGVSVIALRCGGWGDADLAEADAVFDDVSDLLARYDQSPLHKAAPARRNG